MALGSGLAVRFGLMSGRGEVVVGLARSVRSCLVVETRSEFPKKEKERDGETEGREGRWVSFASPDRMRRRKDSIDAGGDTHATSTSS